MVKVPTMVVGGVIVTLVAFVAPIVRVPALLRSRSFVFIPPLAVSRPVTVVGLKMFTLVALKEPIDIVPGVKVSSEDVRTKPAESILTLVLEAEIVSVEVLALPIFMLVVADPVPILMPVASKPSDRTA